MAPRISSRIGGIRRKVLKLDMSHLSRVFTSNVLFKVLEPVMRRVHVLPMPHPTVGELQRFSCRQAAKKGLPASAAEALAEVVGRAGACRQPSLRDVNRMLARAQDPASVPTVH